MSDFCPTRAYCLRGKHIVQQVLFFGEEKVWDVFHLEYISQWIQCQEVFIKGRGTRLREVFWIFEGTDSKLEVSCWWEKY